MASKSLVKSRHDAVEISNKVVDNTMQVTLAQQGVNAEQFKGALREAILANPGIVQTSESSLALAIRKCCMMRVIPDGVHAAIIPFKNEAVMVPMVEGLKLAMAQELGADIRSGVICEGDNFEAVTGSHGTMQSIVIRQDVRTLLNRDPTKIAGAWCSIDVEGQEAFIVVIGKAEIERARKTSASNKVWGTYPDRMAQKTAVKRAIVEYRYKRGINATRLSAMIDAEAQISHDDNIVDVSEPIEMPEEKALEAPAERKTEEKSQSETQTKRRGRPPKKEKQEAAPPPPPPPPPPQESSLELEEDGNDYLPDDDDEDMEDFPDEF